MDYDFYIIKIKLKYEESNKNYYIGDWDEIATDNENDDIYPMSLIMPITEDIIHAAQFDEINDAKEIAQNLKCIWRSPISSTKIIGRNYNQN